MHPLNNLDVVLLIVARDDSVSDEEVEHNNSAVGLELCTAQSLLDVVYAHEVELLDLSVFRYRCNVRPDFEIIDVDDIRTDVQLFAIRDTAEVGHISQYACSTDMPCDEIFW